MLRQSKQNWTDSWNEMAVNMQNKRFSHAKLFSWKVVGVNKLQKKSLVDKHILQINPSDHHFPSIFKKLTKLVSNMPLTPHWTVKQEIKAPSYGLDSSWLPATAMLHNNYCTITGIWQNRRNAVGCAISILLSRTFEYFSKWRFRLMRNQRGSHLEESQFQNIENWGFPDLRNGLLRSRHWPVCAQFTYKTFLKKLQKSDETPIVWRKWYQLPQLAAQIANRSNSWSASEYDKSCYAPNILST